MRGLPTPLPAPREPRVFSQGRAVAAEADEVTQDPHVDGLAEVPRGDRVLIAIDPDEALAVHRRHPIEPVARRCRRERAEGRALRRQQVERPLAMRRRDLERLVAGPVQALLGQVLVIDEAAPRQEVGLHPLHQVFDGPLLLTGAGVAELGMEPHLGREAPEAGVPARLALGVAAEGDGLHVVEHPRPRHPTPVRHDLQHPAQQRLEVHVAPPAHADHTAVLEAPGQEHPLDPLGAEPDFGGPPVPLGVFARQPFEPNHRRRAGGPRLAEPSHEAIERRGAAGIRRRGILPRQLQHPRNRDLGLKPTLQHRPPWLQRGRTLAARRPIGRSGEDPRDRVPVTPGELGDPCVELPLLLQESDRALRHG